MHITILRKTKMPGIKPRKILTPDQILDLPIKKLPNQPFPYYEDDDKKEDEREALMDAYDKFMEQEK